MKWITYLALAAGAVLFALLLMHYGASEVLTGAAAAGWGLLWVTLFRFVNLAADTQGWRVLFAGPTRPAFLPMLRLRWIGEAVNSLLPVAQVGGEVVRAQMATRRGVRGAEAGAATLVDFTLGLVTQFLYTVMAVALLIQTRGLGEETQAWFGGLLVGAAAIAAFWAAQHLQLFGRVAKLAQRVLRGGVWENLTGGATALDAEVKQLYARRRDIAAGAVWRMLSWLLHSGETWLALWFLDAPVSLAAALILEALSTAVRSGAFAVPGAIGVQEGGFVLLAPLVGVSPEIALSLALVKRLRELVIGAGGLAIWGLAGRSDVAQPEDEGKL
jgi:putative membrane protein